MIPQQDIFKRLKREFITKGADHWNFETSPHEKARFTHMLAFAKSVPHASILEIGCAEGHFTKMQCTISADVTAIDVVPIAIQ